VTRAADERGLTGLQELAVAIGVAALLSVGGLFTYQVLVHGADDRTTQASLTTALAAANDVYQDTQDYGLIATDDPSPDGAGQCSLGTAAFTALQSYAAGVTFECHPQTGYAAGTVVYQTGELGRGDAGGWIGLAALAQDGRCWQVFTSADGPAVFGSSDTWPCTAPTGAPAGGDAPW
jgi:hypothetical protein